MRTEQDILKDFAKLGYSVILNKNFVVYLRNLGCVMRIDRITKEYKLYMESANDIAVPIKLKEHKLLHELFKCWGWL